VAPNTRGTVDGATAISQRSAPIGRNAQMAWSQAVFRLMTLGRDRAATSRQAIAQFDAFRCACLGDH
jgi:hypothetical protein